VRWVERLKKQLSIEHMIKHNTTRWQDSVRLNECFVSSKAKVLSDEKGLTAIALEFLVISTTVFLLCFENSGCYL
jgi:hypothetical protein